MSKLQGEILTLPKMSGSVSTTKSLSGNIGAKTVNIGEKGDDGATFIPSVSADGVISWTNDKELPNPEPVNIKGGKGDPGENGKDGADGKPGKDGDQGKPGDDGGYYAPVVTQPGTNTMRFSFTPSKAGMPAVSDTEITIPPGGSGSVAVDSTLTVSGQAADAKVTGDALSSLSEKIADCIKAPTTAEVGQTIVVKAVDENGKPSEWEPVKFPEQVQADWMQSDESNVNHVKNRTHYSRMQFIARARYYGGSQHQRFSGIPSLSTISTICIEINGTLHTDLFGDTVMGDSDSSVWENGGGMGFYMQRNNNDYLIYIDTNRYGPIADATINLYSQTVEKVLPHYYLPVTTNNTIGGVKVDKTDDLSGYMNCVVDENGNLYSKSYNAANIYSELSITNLTAITSYAGDHGLFIDSVAEEFNSYELTLPVHAWFIGVNFSTYAKKYILESADGITMLVEVKNSGITSASVLVEPSSGGSLIVKLVDGTHASHTSAEISEAFQSGKNVQLDVNGIILQLSLLEDANLAAFNGLVATDGEIGNISVTVNNTAEIDILAQKLYPATADTVILRSSTNGSSKRFELMVDDSGTISATEVVL